MTKLPTPTEDNTGGGGGGGTIATVVSRIKTSLTLKIAILIAVFAIAATVLCAVL